MGLFSASVREQAIGAAYYSSGQCWSGCLTVYMDSAVRDMDFPVGKNPGMHACGTKYPAFYGKERVAIAENRARIMQ